VAEVVNVDVDVNVNVSVTVLVAGAHSNRPVPYSPRLFTGVPMRLIPILLVAGLTALPVVAEAPSAELKVGLDIEKLEVKGASESFKVAPGTKIYAWTKVMGCANSKVTFAFLRGDKKVFTQELAVPRSPHRTNAYRTFRAGDAGAWTVKLLAEDGKELASASFKVELD